MTTLNSSVYGSIMDSDKVALGYTCTYTGASCTAAYDVASGSAIYIYGIAYRIESTIGCTASDTVIGASSVDIDNVVTDGLLGIEIRIGTVNGIYASAFF